MIDAILTPIISEATKAVCSRYPIFLKYLKQYMPVQVVSHPSLAEFRDYDYRLKRNPISKAKIANLITTEIIPQLDVSSAKSILLDSGSVTYNIAYQMFNYQLCNITTNNFAIAMLYNEFDHKVPSTCKLLPGSLIKKVCAQAGEETAQAAIEALTENDHGVTPIKIAVLGLRAYSPEKGIAEDTKELTQFQGVLLENAQDLIVVAQGEKFIKPANAPVLNSRDFRYMMDKRREEKSIWFVYHEPTCELSSSQKNMYDSNLHSFLDLLPEDRVFESSRLKNDQRLHVTDEKFQY